MAQFSGFLFSTSKGLKLVECYTVDLDSCNNGLAGPCPCVARFKVCSFSDYFRPLKFLVACESCVSGNNGHCTIVNVRMVVSPLMHPDILPVPMEINKPTQEQSFCRLTKPCHIKKTSTIFNDPCKHFVTFFYTTVGTLTGV